MFEHLNHRFRTPSAISSVKCNTCDFSDGLIDKYSRYQKITCQNFFKMSRKRKLDTLIGKYSTALLEDIKHLFAKKATELIDLETKDEDSLPLAAFKLIKREPIYTTSRDEGCYAQGGDTLGWLLQLQEHFSSLLLNFPDLLKGIYMVSIPVEVSFRYTLDRNAAMDEEFERAKLDGEFTQWNPKWKDCLVVPFASVMEDKNLNNQESQWDWFRNDEKTISLVEKVKNQTKDLLNEICEAEATEVAEDGDESIEKSKLDWGDWDSYVHFDGKDTFYVTLCMYITE